MHAEALNVIVTAIEQVTSSIRQFTLSPVSGQGLPAFSGGSHIVVILDRGDMTFRNPYSLMGSPRDTTNYKIAVRRHDAGRGGSIYLHERVSVGTRLQISPPVNVFPLALLGRKHLLIAGGIGITPILAMISDLRERDLPWELHFGMRGGVQDPFRIRQLDGAGGRVHLYDSKCGPRMNFDQILRQPLGTHVYTCGPAPMIDAVQSEAVRLGWPRSHIHSERFNAPRMGEPFEALLARSGMVVQVYAEQSLLEAIESAGIDAPYLCRGGVCGACETDVLELEGELIHNDHWLSEAEKISGTKIMPCVSRAKCTRIVLDR